MESLCWGSLDLLTIQLMRFLGRSLNPLMAMRLMK